MEKWFEKYKRFFGAIFLLWLFLWTARKLGFDFRIDMAIFFRVFLLLFLVLIIGEIKLRWAEIYPLLKEASFSIKNKVLTETKNTQEEIIAFSPKILTGKIGGPFALFLAILFLSFFTVWQATRKILVFLLSRSGALAIAILAILLDIFVFDFSSSLVVLLFAALWIRAVRLYQFRGGVSIVGGLIFLVISPFLLNFKEKPIMPEKAAIWAYVFLVIGTGQMFIKYLKEERKHARIKNK